MLDYLYLGLYYTFKFFIWLIPQKLMFYIAKGLAQFLYLIDTKHKKIANVNLMLAYEETLSDDQKKAIVKGAYLNLVLLLIDFIRNQGISREALLKKVTFENEHILEDALATGEKLILVTAHYGNWELLPLSLAAKFGPLTGVGRKLDSEAMDNILKQNREQFDIDMLDKKGAMKDMIKVLKNDRLLGLLVDQNTSKNEGILVDFFAKPVRHTPSAAVLARRFNALIIPAFITTEGINQYKITFYKPIETAKTEDKEKDILDSVQKQAKITEEIIRQRPEAWFWLHKRWKNQFEEKYND